MIPVIITSYTPVLILQVCKLFLIKVSELLYMFTKGFESKLVRVPSIYEYKYNLLVALE